jgi:hypothetical protein
MENFSENVTKYLLKYSSAKWNLEITCSSNIDSVIVIPAISEFQNLYSLLKSLAKNDNKYFPSTLIIFVINNSVSSNDDVKENNQKNIELIRSIIYKNGENEFIKEIITSGLRFALVDASSAGREIPDKEAGVGFARKIGMDLALTVFNYSSQKKKLIICLDADCTVQNNYLTEVVDNFNEKNLSAAVINFEHNITEEKNTKAIICYEILLRYYTLGLHFANSPFAYQVVGSTVACDYETYIKVEGMNKRKAAEDFYFLEKIAKRVLIEKIKSTKVFPSSRSSWRVPFGTGQRVARFLSKFQNEYLLYDPETFLILRDWLKVFNSPEALSCEEYLSLAEEINVSLHQFLIDNKFEIVWNKILNSSKSQEQINKQKNNWFDAFRTLKFVHYLRDNVFQLINMFDALDNILTYYNYSLIAKREKNEIPKIEDQVIYLRILRGLT